MMITRTAVAILQGVRCLRGVGIANHVTISFPLVRNEADCIR